MCNKKEWPICHCEIKEKKLKQNKFVMGKTGQWRLNYSTT